jgi:hypothetical protein
MGNAFQEYVIQQKEWKARLEDLFRQGSPVEIESKLLDSGVVKSNRARYWISPESIQPASRTDFIALLKYLKFSREEIDVITKLTSAYDSLLIAEGREASKAIADTLEEFEYSQLDLGRPVEITLENYGDATYLIAPHHGILEVDIHCRPSQVRQVIQYSVEEKSL